MYILQLKELIQKETLDAESISPESINLDEILSSDEVWVMDIPKSVRNSIEMY